MSGGLFPKTSKLPLVKTRFAGSQIGVGDGPNSVNTMLPNREPAGTVEPRRPEMVAVSEAVWPTAIADVACVTMLGWPGVMSDAPGAWFAWLPALQPAAPEMSQSECHVTVTWSPSWLNGSLKSALATV